MDRQDGQDTEWKHELVGGMVHRLRGISDFLFRLFILSILPIHVNKGFQTWLNRINRIRN